MPRSEFNFRVLPTLIKLGFAPFYQVVPSTFSRAIDYSALFLYLNEAKQKEREIRMITINFKTSNKTKKIEEIVNRSEKRTYELLALFTGIITFLFSVVNIFTVNNNSDLKLLITNTMGLGFILLLFVGLILLTSPAFLLEVPVSVYKKTLRYKFLRILLPLYIILIIISYFNYPISNSIDEKEKKESKEPLLINQITIPENKNNIYRKDTILLYNNNTILIKQDSISDR